MSLMSRGEKDRNAKAVFAKFRANGFDLQAGVRLRPPIDAFVRLKNKKASELVKPVFSARTRAKSPKIRFRPVWRWAGIGETRAIQSEESWAGE
jgi:hypothetical protein